MIGILMELYQRLPYSTKDFNHLEQPIQADTQHNEDCYTLFSQLDEMKIKCVKEMKDFVPTQNEEFKTITLEKQLCTNTERRIMFNYLECEDSDRNQKFNEIEKFLKPSIEFPFIALIGIKLNPCKNAKKNNFANDRNDIEDIKNVFNKIKKENEYSGVNCAVNAESECSSRGN